MQLTMAYFYESRLFRSIRQSRWKLTVSKDMKKLTINVQRPIQAEMTDFAETFSIQKSASLSALNAILNSRSISYENLSLEELFSRLLLNIVVYLGTEKVSSQLIGEKLANYEKVRISYVCGKSSSPHVWRTAAHLISFESLSSVVLVARFGSIQISSDPFQLISKLTPPHHSDVQNRAPIELLDDFFLLFMPFSG